MIQILKTIKDGFTSIGINYEFMEWTSSLIYPYWVSEYEDIGAVNEDGMTESTLILTGTTRGSWLELETMKAQIIAYFEDRRVIADNGNGIVFSFDRALVIPTGEQELKRIQINLQIKEWKVN